MEQGSESLAGEARGRAAIYSVELEVFEGPLDLLLHLVRRHELDILDIPIAFVAVKYLEYLDLMRSLDLEVAGDYLVMAATLAWLKSRELLPAEPRAGEEAGADDEEGEDPRQALIRRLVEYERFKSAAAELDAMPVSGRDVFARGADIDVPPMDPGLAPVTLFRLAEAYYRVLTRAKIQKSHEVTIEPVTVAQRMQQLTLMLEQRQEFEFEGLFLGRTWSSEAELRSMLVVTLMSVLELVKLGVAKVQQVPDTDAIRVYRLVAADEALRLIETYDEEQSFGAPVDAGPPAPTEAELDAAEANTLLAEALAGVLSDDADLGPDAAAAAAANVPVFQDMSETTGHEDQAATDESAANSSSPDAARSADTPVAPEEGAASRVERDPPPSDATHDVDAAAQGDELDAELRALAAELAALDEAEAVADTIAAARQRADAAVIDLRPGAAPLAPSAGVAGGDVGLDGSYGPALAGRSGVADILAVAHAAEARGEAELAAIEAQAGEGAPAAAAEQGASPSPAEELDDDLRALAAELAALDAAEAEQAGVESNAVELLLDAAEAALEAAAARTSASRESAAPDEYARTGPLADTETAAVATSPEDDPGS